MAQTSIEPATEDAGDLSQDSDCQFIVDKKLVDALLDWESLAYDKLAAETPAAHQPKSKVPKGRGQAKAKQRNKAKLDPDVTAEAAASDVPPQRPAKKLRQAEETIGGEGKVEVQILCPQCRRDASTKRQMTLVEATQKASRPEADGEAVIVLDEVVQDPLHPKDIKPSQQEAAGTLGSPSMATCGRCRRSLVIQHLSVGKEKRVATVAGCPLKRRLKQYKAQAQQTSAKWELADDEAFAFMRRPCVLCGAPPDLERGHPNGLTRLRTDKACFGMGPYAAGNVATACTTCNMVKGIHTLKEARQICRHIATARGLGDFGRFPRRFRDNISRKSRSSYIGDTSRKSRKGTPAAKTHCLSNEQFKEIVSKPCHYCGKESDPPRHYNGLDRLDNSLRLYTAENVVSCCSTCNMAKGRFTEDVFLEHCRLISLHALAHQDVDADVDSHDTAHDDESARDDHEEGGLESTEDDEKGMAG
eukprot:4633199-Amphidinium_carterae.1